MLKDDLMQGSNWCAIIIVTKKCKIYLQDLLQNKVFNIKFNDQQRNDERLDVGRNSIVNDWHGQERKMELNCGNYAI